MIYLGQIRYQWSPVHGLGVTGKFTHNLPKHLAHDWMINGIFTGKTDPYHLLPQGTEALKSVITLDELLEIELNSQQWLEILGHQAKSFNHT